MERKRIVLLEESERVMRDRTGQIWLIGYSPYCYPALIVHSEELSASLATHVFVRLDDASRTFDVEEMIHRFELEQRSDMKRVL